jgi:hypothetical protein
MKKYLLFCLILLLIGCKETHQFNDACGGSNPISNLPWLNEIFKDIENQSCNTITQSKIGNTIVFGVTRCTCCFAISVPILYKYDGTLYCTNQGDKVCQDAIIESSKNAIVLYEKGR